MSRHRKIDIRMWGDSKFRALSTPAPCGQWLWVYLMTGPHTTNLPGLFQTGEAALAEALGWLLQPFRKAFNELASRGMVKADWAARVVYIPNAIRYNEPESPNVVRAWRNAWDEIPECHLKEQARASYRAYITTKGKAFQEAFQEAFGEGLPEGSKGDKVGRETSSFGNQEQEQEQEQEEEDPPNPPAGGIRGILHPTDEQTKPPGPTAQAVQDAWNETAKKSGWSLCCRMGEQRMKSFNARLRDSHWIDNWRTALAKAAALLWLRGENARQWVADIDWFLRPRTVARILEGKYDDRPARNGQANGAARFGSVRSAEAMGRISRLESPEGKYDNIGRTVRIGPPPSAAGAGTSLPSGEGTRIEPDQSNGSANAS